MPKPEIDSVPCLDVLLDILLTQRVRLALAARRKPKAEGRKPKSSRCSLSEVARVYSSRPLIGGHSLVWSRIGCGVLG